MKIIRNTLLLLSCLTFAVSCEVEKTINEYDVLALIAESETFNEWPSWNDLLKYDFGDENKNFEAPTKNLPYRGQTSMIRDYGWWSYFAGPRANELVKDNTEAIDIMLKELDENARVIREEMGWPPTTAVRNGYRDAVFLFGSGLSTDNASNTDLGGWQSGITLGGVNYPMVLLSYYPVNCFSPDYTDSDKYYQTDAVTHEYIHAIFASMPGCRKASWFHEGANCWLQAAMTATQDYPDGNFEVDSFGWLCAGSVIAPFIPIECYSGWLLDGSFGGPGAQGVNENFRETIGGIQYSEVFPTFLGEIVGKYSVPWIWMNCEGYVLEGIADEIGKEKTQAMIQEYRARLALCDFKRYTNAALNLYRSNMGAIFGSDVDGKYVDPWKATPYTSLSLVESEEEIEELTKATPEVEEPEDMSFNDEGWLKPDELTLPGWTGANIVPIKVDGDKVLVAFAPFGDNATGDNMSCQLCYRTAEGKTVYGNPIKGGCYMLDLSKDRPANDVVFAVVCNLDYTFSGNTNIRKKKYDYRMKISSNAHVANIHKSWFDWSVEQ